MSFVKQVAFAKIASLRAGAARDGVLVDDRATTIWIGAFVGLPVGCVGLDVKPGNVRCRGAYVAPEYRGSGIYRQLCTARASLVAEKLRERERRLDVLSERPDVWRRRGFEIVKHGGVKAGWFYLVCHDLAAFYAWSHAPEEHG